MIQKVRRVFWLTVLVVMTGLVTTINIATAKTQERITTRGFGGGPEIKGCAVHYYNGLNQAKMASNVIELSKKFKYFEKFWQKDAYDSLAKAIIELFEYQKCLSEKR